MTKWTEIHSDVYISGADGFSFVKIRVPAHDWRFDDLSKEEREFVELCLPGHKPRVINGVERPYEPMQALRMYLCEAMSHTFAMTQQRNFYYIGMRSKKDKFKLKLKFPDIEDVKVWSMDMQFYVRVAEGDTFSDKATLKRMQDERYHV